MRQDEHEQRTPEPTDRGRDGQSGAAAPEPSLVARIAHGSEPEDLLDGASAASTLPREDPDRSAGGGSGAQTRVGRVDAGSATYGSRTGTTGGVPAGEPPSSVGGPEGDTRGEGVADQPPRPGQQGAASRAGFLEDLAGRRGTDVTGGTIRDDEGGHIRSAAEIAGDRDREGRPEPE